jgi:peptidoglycan/LPS O-acetylase OafA/YrhL
MTGTARGVVLDPPGWTLVHELRISLIFPLLILLCRNRRRGALAAFGLVAAATALLVHVGEARPFAPPSIGVSLLWTAQIVPYFVTGILLNRKRAQLRAAWQRHPRLARAAAFTAAAAMLMIGYDFTAPPRILLYALGAAAMIALATQDGLVRTFLTRPLLQWLGRISYSLYLVHAPIMLLAVPLLIGRTPFAVMTAVLVALSLAAAAIFHEVVEAPAIRFGRYVTRSVAPRRIPGPVSVTTGA